MSHAHAEGAAPKPHVLPIRLYLAVWAGLLVLTVITVGVSYFHFGTWNLVVAMAVATVKASLVALFFMHLKYDEKFNGVILLGSLACLGLFFVLTLADTLHRGSVDPVEAREIAPVPGRPEFMRERGILPDGSPAPPDSARANGAGAVRSAAVEVPALPASGGH